MKPSIILASLLLQAKAQSVRSEGMDPCVSMAMAGLHLWDEVAPSSCMNEPGQVALMPSASISPSDK